MNINLGSCMVGDIYSTSNYRIWSAIGTYSGAFPAMYGVASQPIAPPIRKCDYCGTKYYEKLEENKALVCPSCGGPR